MNIKKWILSITGIVLLWSSQVTAQLFKDYEWHTLSCNGEPVQRHEAAFVAVNDHFYLLGGRRIQKVSIFNPKTSTWTSGAKPPIEMHHFQGFTYKDKAYVVGAHTGKYPRETPLPDAYVYDPATNNWSKAFPMPKDRHRGSTTAAVYKDKLYIAGGIIDGHWDGHVTWFDVYDFNTKKWDILPDAPHARDHATSVVYDDKLYMLGGRRSSRVINKVLELTEPAIDVFDFKKGTWSTLETPIASEFGGCTGLVINDKILYTGGESAHQVKANNKLAVFDPATETWSTLPALMEGRHGTQLIAYDNKLYIASGCAERGGSTELKTIECFSL